MQLGTLFAVLLGDVFSGKIIVLTGGGVIKAGNEIKIEFLMWPYLLTYLKIQRYFQNKPKFKGVYSQKNLPNTVKDRAYIVNLEEYKSLRTHWKALYANGNSVTYFDSFGVKRIPEKIKKFFCSKYIKQISSEHKRLLYDKVWILLH